MTRLPHPGVRCFWETYVYIAPSMDLHCKYHIYLHIYISHIHVLGEEDDESSEPERDPKRGAGRRSGTPSEKQPASGEKTPVDTDAEQRH